MKRIDKNKVYTFIRQAVVYTSMWATTVLGIVWAFGQTTIYR